MSNRLSIEEKIFFALLMNVPHSLMRTIL